MYCKGGGLEQMPYSAAAAVDSHAEFNRDERNTVTAVSRRDYCDRAERYARWCM